MATSLLLLGAALILGRRGRRPLPGALPLVPGLLLHGVLAALALGSALRPSSALLAFPFDQVALCVAAAALLSATLYGARQTSEVSARVLDSPTVDSLTRIASHRVFQDRLAYECERAARLNDTFVLLLLDLDDFRPVNERFGHRVGDRVLVESARRLRTQLREIDLVARYQGDRFAMILPHTFEKPGREVAERLRQCAAGWVFPTNDGEIRLTASVGVAVFPRDAESPSELVDAATKSLELAKTLGGNQVQTFGELPPQGHGGTLVSLPHRRREAIVRSLAEAVDIRDGYTHKHSHLVSRLSAAVARSLGLSATDISRITIGALLHDVGKIGVPDAILTKEGTLTEEEWECIRRHPVLGQRIIGQAPELTDIMPLVLHHQERWDGSGYPAGLKGEEIPLGARIIAAADAYHAIRSDRPYRPARTHRQAAKELRNSSGTQLDPRVVEALLSVLEQDPALREMRLTLPEADLRSPRRTAKSSYPASVSAAFRHN